MLKLRFLGGLSVERQPQLEQEIKTQKTLALICYLVITQSAYSRSQLAGLLWPEMPESKARANLRKVISQLRSLDPYFTITREKIAFNSDAPYWCDAAEFEYRIRDAGDMEQLAAAVDLFQGDFLEGFYLRDAPAFEQWMLVQRTRIREETLQALAALIDYYGANGSYEQAISYARRLLTIEPWREDAQRSLMRYLGLSGQRGAALKQYEIGRQILADELDVTPAAETTALYEQIRDQELGVATGLGDPSLAAEVNPLRQSAMPQRLLGNLPAAITPFIGREAELLKLAALIADPQVRIITITGPGGMGKTRLALEAARREMDQPSQFPNGIYFVPLAPVDSADDILTALAAAIGFQFQGSEPEKEQLLNYLRQKHMLLIMDNFEHILEGHSLLTEIIRRAAHIKLLVTTRERLQMRSEQLFPIQGLALTRGAEAAAESPAALLFLQTARRNAVDFQLSAADVGHLLRICRLVEGMPLGLELAASWVRMLTLAEIADEIEQSLNLLTAEHKDVPERHRSMRAALDASWRRLAVEQQCAFQELTVFQGGFTRQAALIATSASLPLLVSLVNTSWLSYDRQEDRYHIHMLLRQYGIDKPSLNPGHENTVREKQSTYFCDFLQERETDWHGPRQLDAAKEVQIEISNIQRAWRWAATWGESCLLARGLNSLCAFYFREGRLIDGQNACRLAADGLERSLAQQGAENAQDLALWSQVLAWESDFGIDLERKEKLLTKSQKMLDRAAGAGRDTRAEQASLYLYKSYAASLTDLKETIDLANMALELFQELDNKVGAAESLKMIGSSHLFQGDHALASNYLYDSLAISRHLGDIQGIAHTMSVLGMAARHVGEFEEAERLMRSAIGLYRQVENRFEESNYLASLSIILSHAGKFPAAVQAVSQAIIIARNLGVYPDTWHLNALVLATLHLGDYSKAQATGAESLELARKKGELQRVGWALEMLGEISFAQGNLEQAKDYLQESVAVLKGLHHVYQALPQAILGYVFRALGNVEPVNHALLGALRMGVQKHSIFLSINCLPIAALLAADNEQPEQAVELYGLAQQFGHIRNSRWYQDIALRELDSVRASLPPDVARAAEARGREMDVWQTAETLLRELDRPLRR